MEIALLCAGAEEEAILTQTEISLQEEQGRGGKDCWLETLVCERQKTFAGFWSPLSSSYIQENQQRGMYHVV